MKALRILFAILLSVLLFVSQAALFCLFVADRLISPAALTSAVEGAGLMDSIVSDLMTSMDLAADAADAGPLNAYAGRLAADVVASLVRGDTLPHVDETELADLLSDLLVPAIGDTAETVGALMATELAAQLNDMLASRLSLAVTLGITTRSLAILETLFSPVTRILLAVAILLFGLLLVLVLGKRRRKGRIGLIWWSVTAALSGIAVLLCGVGMNSALLSARDTDSAQFVDALQKSSGGAFTLFGLLGLGVAALLLGLYFATKPRRRRVPAGSSGTAARRA